MWWPHGTSALFFSFSLQISHSSDSLDEDDEDEDDEDDDDEDDDDDDDDDGLGGTGGRLLPGGGGGTSLDPELSSLFPDSSTAPRLLNGSVGRPSRSRTLLIRFWFACLAPLTLSGIIDRRYILYPPVPSPPPIPSIADICTELEFLSNVR